MRGAEHKSYTQSGAGTEVIIENWVFLLLPVREFIEMAISIILFLL